ncbi:MAG: OB-fold nucleic acid binding domain-containing protein [Nitrospirae bacterium]|nr:OB-fold nucleic acid binding domain-containing protein [Nitrospirota bacterium]
MKSGRLFPALLAIILIGGAAASPAFAEPETRADAGKSGLNFNSGYDVNTVSTVTGRVIALPEPGGSGHAVIVIQARDERINLVVGPGQFWEKQGLAVSMGDEVMARGSVAQGRDGNTYMFTQKIECRQTGGSSGASTVTLRNERGAPLWMDRHPAMTREHGGDGRMRDRGGMMRGGERGMMRR